MYAFTCELIVVLISLFYAGFLAFLRAIILTDSPNSLQIFQIFGGQSRNIIREIIYVHAPLLRGGTSVRFKAFHSHDEVDVAHTVGEIQLPNAETCTN